MRKQPKNLLSTRQLIADARAHVTDENLFCSAAFKAHLEHMAAIHTSRYAYSCRIRIQMDWCPQPASTLACTNNRDIHINAGHPIVDQYVLRNQKYLFILGLFVHELGHVLYTDFPAWSSFHQSVCNGQWKPVVDPSSPDSLQHAAAEIQAFLDASLLHRQVLADVLQDLLNILEDAYIELCLLKKFSGVFGQALSYVRNDYFAKTPSLSEQENAHLSFWAISTNLLLYYARFHTFPFGDETDKHPCVQALTPCLEAVQAGILDTLPKRLQAVNTLLLHLWPLIDPETDWAPFFARHGNAAVQPEKNETFNPPFTDIPLGNTHPVEQIVLDPTDLIQGTNQTGQEKQGNEGPPCAHDKWALDQVLTEVAVEHLETQRVSALNQSLQKMDRGDLHNDINTAVHRACSITQAAREQYWELAQPLLPLSARLQKELRRELLKRKYPQKAGGYAFGKRMDCRHLYRVDQKVFTKNVAAKKGLDLAVALLLDESGSMSLHNRYRYTQSAAIILQDFCYQLHIPLMLYGHSTSGYQVDLYSYVEFDTFSDLDRYRLVDIQARSSNRDGAALRYVGNRLLARPEQNKVLILVSDGKPAHVRYSGPTAENDLKAFRSDFIHRGGLFVAATIGDDQEAIHRIYGQSFLDITDLSLFPMHLTQYLKRNIRL